MSKITAVRLSKCCFNIVSVNCQGLVCYKIKIDSIIEPLYNYILVRFQNLARLLSKFKVLLLPLANFTSVYVDPSAFYAEVIKKPSAAIITS